MTGCDFVSLLQLISDSRFKITDKRAAEMGSAMERWNRLLLKACSTKGHIIIVFVLLVPEGLTYSGLFRAVEILHTKNTGLKRKVEISDLIRYLRLYVCVKHLVYKFYWLNKGTTGSIETKIDATFR